MSKEEPIDHGGIFENELHAETICGDGNILMDPEGYKAYSTMNLNVEVVHRYASIPFDPE